MYGGLFGDLPPEKSSAAGETAATSSNNDGNEKSGETSNVDTGSNKKPRTVEEPKSTKSSASSSVVKNLGVAGTSMAFVPTAALQRKRNSATKTTTKTTAAKSSSSSSSNPPQSSSVKTEPLVATTNFALPIWKDAAEDGNNDNDRSTSATSEPQSSVEKGESEEIRQLHESVTDPYDPLIPNDLLQHWERQAAILERQELEREARETMETQKRIREQLESERLELEKSGDVDKLVEYQQRRVGAGRGRGRGISNLPAWYVEKQKKEAEGRLQPPSGD